MTVSQVIVLAAGRGERLRPLTDAVPKCLVSVGGVSFLERTLKAFEAYPELGICIVTGFLRKKIETFVRARFAHRPIHFCHNPFFAETNNAYSLWIALKEHRDSFLLLDGDLLFHPALLERLLEDRRENVVAVDDDRGRLTDEAMKFRLYREGAAIAALGKEIPSSRADGESIGMGKFSKEWTEELRRVLEETMQDPRQAGQLYYEDVMNLCLKKAPPLGALPVGELPWAEVDTLEDLKAAQTWGSSLATVSSMRVPPKSKEG